MNLNRQEYYEAFCRRDSQYDGVFYTAIKTTGIFCRTTCSARTPKIENCEFFKNVQDASLAGYRPCKRCKPLSVAGAPSEMVEGLLKAVENNVEHRWCDKDVREMGLDPSTVRRQFQKHYSMTFVAYARARRMGLALKAIRNGEDVIEAQLGASYESSSGFRDAFSKTMGVPPKHAKHVDMLKASWLETPLGAMLALVDDTALHLLEFTDRRGLEREIEVMRKRYGKAIIPGRTDLTDQIEEELEAYFSGKLRSFNTPLKIYGSEFQGSVMEELMNIPYAKIRSYKQQSNNMGRPTAVRAIARANGMNQIAIVIPCHRVIGSDGSMTGYAGGIARKQWLLEHEQIQIRKNPPE